MGMLLILTGVIALVSVVIMVCVISLRRVVPANAVHIVQATKKTIPYGSTTENGNVYYEFPDWVPVLGVTVSKLTTSVFSLDLSNYEAYDKDRVPFVVDIKAFFRIEDPIVASGRVSTFQELHGQLQGIVQGAVRSILAKENLESIMCERTVYGDKFTIEVSPQLKEWGVTPVKNIELMDIRDSAGNCNISNIMAKKESEIEMESRIEVANNKQKAQEAEIKANQEVSLKNQEATQQVGLKEATVTQQVGIAQEQSKQKVQEQAKLTAEKEMEVQKVREVQAAEISKQANTVNAEANKNITVLNAEATKQQMELDAEAKLTVATKNAAGVEIEGKAKAEAEKAIQLAPVEAQIKLAKEIGTNTEYQKYLITLEQIKAMVEVGIKQAENLGKADVKIFANSGSVSNGVNGAANIFSSNSGLNIGALLEGLNSTESGKELLNTVQNLVAKPKDITGKK